MRARQRLLLRSALHPGPLRVALGLFALLGALGAAPLRAQDPFDLAERARSDARLEDAHAAYRAVLESGQLGLSEVAHAHLRLAELAFLGGELESGRRHLRYALALRPDAPVGDGPASMRAAAAATSSARSGRALRAVFEISDPRAPIVFRILDAPEGLVRVVEVRGSRGWSRTLAWDGEARELDPPAEARPLRARLLDAYGNALGVAGVWSSAPPSDTRARSPSPASQPDPGAPDGDSVLTNPWLWVALGVVVLVAGLAIGFTAVGDTYVVGAPEAP